MGAVVEPGAALPGGVSGGASTATQDCRHCSLPIPAQLRAAGSEYCCSGCETVAALIRDGDLDQFYAVKGDRKTAPPLRPMAETYAWVGDLFAGEDGTAGAGDGATAGNGAAPALLQLDLEVQGVHCAACVWLLQQLFRRSAGGVDLRMNAALGTARLTWRGSRDALVAYFEEAAKFGYRFAPRPERGAEAPRRPARHALVRLGICVALSMNVMIFAISFHLGLAPVDATIYSVFGALNVVLATLVVAIGGAPFFSAAFRSLRRGVVHLDLPIAVGMTLAYLGSLDAHFRHGPEAAYFDSLVAFVSLMLVGRWLQERHLERNRHSLLSATDIADLRVRRAGETGLDFVPAGEVAVGDRLCVAPGDLVPMAGVLDSPQAFVSLEWISGEAAPRELTRGDVVPSGAVVVGGEAVELIARERLADSQVQSLFAETAGAPVFLDPWWQRLGTIWVTGIFALAAAAWLVWWPAGIDAAARVTVAVLVVTCPCALGIAAPLAHDLALGRLRQRGVFVRRGDFFARARRVRQIIFDKTGTLTHTELELTADSRRELLARAPHRLSALRAAVARSNHPVSRALDRELRDAGVVEATVAPPAQEVAGEGLIGSPLAELRAATPAAAGSLSADGLSGPRAEWRSAGASPVTLEFREALKPDAGAEVRRLRELGYDLSILSGDEPGRVHAVARELGIAAEEGRVSPAGKAERVAALDEDGSTFMVGDGLNDAPAFAAAGCSATPAVDHAALAQSADLYFLGSGLAAVRQSLQTAHRLRSVQNGNLLFAVTYNVFALAACFAGWVGPAAAAVLMPASSIAVVALTVTRMKKDFAWD